MNAPAHKPPTITLESRGKKVPPELHAQGAAHLGNRNNQRLKAATDNKTGARRAPTIEVD